MEEDRYNNLIGLRDLLSQKITPFKSLGRFEMFFFGTNSSGGCQCNLPTVKSKLRELMRDIGEKEIEDYGKGK
jgi:hypothetical protein